MAKTPKGRRTIKPIHWGKVRAEWEADPKLTFKAISARFGGRPAKQTIGQRAKREGWTRVDPNATDVQKAISNRADAKAGTNPIVTPETPDEVAGEPTPLAKHAAIEARASVIDRHRRELNLPRTRLYAALQEGSFDKMKQAKISAETLSIVQAAERKAWGLDGDPTIVFQVIPPSQRDQHD